MKKAGNRIHFNKIQRAVLCFFGAVSLFFFLNGQPCRQELTENLNPVSLGFLQPGEYTLEITYEHSPGGNVLCIGSDEMIDGNNRLGILFRQQELPEGSGVIRVPLSLDRPSYGVYVRTARDREDRGYLTRVIIQSNGLIYKDNYALCIIMAASGILLALLFRKNSPEKGPGQNGGGSGSPGLVLTGMGLLASLPLFSQALLWGDDTAFHLVRLEGIYQALASGVFPVRITPQQMAGYGTLTASMYPQLFLYPAALLRFCGVSLVLCYKILLTGTNIATAFAAYYSGKNVCGSRNAGMWVSVLYTFSVYRLTNMYVRGALGETLAMIFLPLVIWGVYEILWGKRRWTVLVLGMTGVLESHLLSVWMCIPFMAAELAVWLLSRRKDRFGKRFLDGCRAVGVTALLNACFLVPFFFFGGEDFQCFDMPFEVSQHGAYFSQLFTFFPSVDGASLGPGTTQYEMPLSIGGILLGGVILFLITEAKTKERGTEKSKEAEKGGAGFRCMIYGTAALLMASWLFPWERIGQTPFLGSLFTPLQFAWRFLAPATAFWSFTAALGITGAAGCVRNAGDNRSVRGNAVYAAAAVLVLISAAYFFDGLACYRYQRSDKMALEGLSDADGMYLYRDSDTFRAIQLDYHRWEGYIQTKNGTAFSCSGFEKQGGRISVRITPQGKGEDILMFPLYWFPGYEIRINGEKTPVFAADTLVACEMPRDGCEIEVYYGGMWFFRLGDITTAAAVCGILVRGMFLRRRRRKAPG